MTSAYRTLQDLDARLKRADKLEAERDLLFDAAVILLAKSGLLTEFQEDSQMRWAVHYLNGFAVTYMRERSEGRVRSGPDNPPQEGSV